MVEITLKGPGMNALSTSVFTQLLADLDAAGGQPVLLKGDGRAFSAGLNLKEVLSMDEAALVRFMDLLDEVVRTLYYYPGPTVACAHGHAIAGGCVLVMACDYRVITDNPKVLIGLKEAALGMPLPPSVKRLAKVRLPREHLETVVLGAGLCGPADALRFGLVDEISADAEGCAKLRLQQLARHPSQGYAINKRYLREGALDVSPEERASFLEDLLPVMFSDEVQSGLKRAVGG